MHFTERFVTKKTGIKVNVYNMVTLKPREVDVSNLEAGMIVKETSTGNFAMVLGKTVEDDLDYLIHLTGNKYYSPLLLE